ncbi:MAG: DUF3048 domain-containing protein [Roseburia sp.]|nr:DUF3048 domain-containing protein [Roseburia sp.]
MRHMKKTLLFASICCLAFAGCGKSNEETPENTEELLVLETETEITVEPETETETETEAVEDLGSRGLLTGEPVDEVVAHMRPVSCMVGNTTDAMPQYGISNADVIVEAPAEGGLTRIMPIFQDYRELPTIMSQRSCRHYFAYLSNEFDSIYVHYGQAIYATEMLKSMDDLNGLDGDLENVTFYRDSSRKSPHNAYINGDSIQAGIDKREYRTTLPDGFQHYIFAKDGEEVTLDNGEAAVVVEPGFPVNKPWFEYDESTGLYKRFQYKSAHIDGGNGEQLAFKNIIFRVCDYKMEPDNKYLDVKTATYDQLRPGKYITNGKAIDITWTKSVEDGKPHYFDADGNELVINQGKTCVCIVLDDSVEKMGVYASKSEFEAARE